MVQHIFGYFLLTLSNIDLKLKSNVMYNKENIPNYSPQNWQPQITFSAKPCKRYPMNQIFQSANSSMQASSIKPKKFMQSIQIPQGLCEKSELGVSIRDKFNSRHLNSVHELIAMARQKKSDIQDLLRSQQHKAQNEDQDSYEIGSSLRKLKKVVRLLQIVYKMINGNQKNNASQSHSLFDGQQSLSSSVYPHQQIFSHQIYQQKIQNMQHQLQVKQCEIRRLKKLVELLTAPQKSQNKQDRHSSSQHLQSYENQEAKTCSIANISQRYQDQAVYCQIGVQASQQQLHTIKIAKNDKFEYVNVFSFWTILHDEDHGQINEFSPIKNISMQQKMQECEEDTFQKYQTNIPSTFISHHNHQQKFTICSYPQIFTIDNQVNYLKRFKSVVKIAMNSLNLCLRLMSKEKTDPKIILLNQKLSNFAQYFNQNYHIRSGVYSEQFGKQAKFKLKQVYDNIHQVL